MQPYCSTTDPTEKEKNMEPLRTVWQPGDKTALAKGSGISIQYLSDIIHGRYRATPERAVQIEAAARVLGLRLDRLDVLYPHESGNPLIEVNK